jgi:4-hydroxyphenylpyruvate dioxygenase
MEPTVEKDEFGEVVRSGNLYLRRNGIFFCGAQNYAGVFLPGYKEIRLQSGTNWLKYIDHMVEM